MTIKKTVQMIALSGVLAIGVSGYAMAVVKNEEWYDSRINAAVKDGDHDSAAYYRDLKNKRYGFGETPVAVSGKSEERNLDLEMEKAKNTGNILAQEHFQNVKDKVPFTEKDGIEKTLEDLENEQRDVAAIHNALSGIHYIFGKDDKYSVSTSVGFHNSANVALAVGLSGKPADNIMVFGSLSSSASMEHFGANVGVSVAF